MLELQMTGNIGLAPEQPATSNDFTDKKEEDLFHRRSGKIVRAVSFVAILIISGVLISVFVPLQLPPSANIDNSAIHFGFSITNDSSVRVLRVQRKNGGSPPTLAPTTALLVPHTS